ncbi:MAG: virulence RhuM family protein [Erysipelotrichaceae bacterium]|nr:virulence RhuM family protein [Erysipelotrichaceae bacterium]
MKNEIVLFNDGNVNIEVQVSPEQETVWLTRNQIAALFDRDVKTIGKHINNALHEELIREEVVAKFATTTQHGAIKDKTQTHMTEHYNLDMIISVGYRVKSNRGIAFRKWANRILKDYILKGYALNQKRLEALNRTVDIQSRMISSLTETPQDEVYEVVNKYTDALTLLDEYDHQNLKRPEGNDTVYRLSYEECRKLIDSMTFNSDVFGVEKEKGKLEGILAAVYQNVFGTEVYPSIEEKASNLLYFLIKDHPFADGCKRIGATIFLEFLNKNNSLFKNGIQIISNSALVAITLMIAESRPEEKEIMITLMMNFLAK